MPKTKLGAKGESQGHSKGSRVAPSLCGTTHQKCLRLAFTRYCHYQ